MTVSGIELVLHCVEDTSTFKLDSKPENLISEVDDRVSTYTSLQRAIEERSIIRKIFDVVIKIVLVPFELILAALGAIKTAWDGFLHACQLINAVASLKRYRWRRSQ